MMACSLSRSSSRHLNIGGDEATTSNNAANANAADLPSEAARPPPFVKEVYENVIAEYAGAQQQQQQALGSSPLANKQNRTPDASTLGTALDLTYEHGFEYDSACTSLDRTSPCEGMGRMVVDSFFRGCTSVLDYGDRLCSIMRMAERNKKKWGHGVDDGEGDLPMGVMAETPHPLPDRGGNLTEKMDELLKLLKDKESSASSVRSREVNQAGEGKGGARESAAVVVAATAENEKEKDVFPTVGENNNDAVDQANQLIGMFQTMNTSLNRFGILDESSISKASEMVGFRFDSLLLDPTLEEVKAKSKPASLQDPMAPTNHFDASLSMDESRDDLSFNDNYKGVLVTGEARPQTEAKPEKGATAASGRPPLPLKSCLKAVARPTSFSMAAASPAKERDNTAFIGLVDSTKAMTHLTATAANEASPKSQGRKPNRGVLKEPSFDAKRDGKGAKAASTWPPFAPRTAGSPPSLTTVAASPQKEPEEPGSSASSMDSPGSAAPSTPTSKSQGIKSPTGQRGRKILKDIKNCSRKNGIPRRGRGKTASRAVDVTVEDRRNGSSEWYSVPNGQDPSSSAATADFSSVDDMGFPLSNATAGGGGEGRASWEGTFSAEVNPFVAGACVPVNETADSGVPVCGWCGKGGNGDPEVAERLKLCSRCQSTYYCSPECQSRDWINGHAETCRPT